jgi:hypothetical protein
VFGPGNVGSELVRALPFDKLHAIPRVGETIRLSTETGTITNVEYEFIPDVAPMRMADEMPQDRSYARPVRIVVKLS